MLRYVAPAGAPVTMIDLCRWTASALSHEPAEARLATAVSARFGVPHVVATSTGRAGMTILLRAMRRLAPAHRTEVLLPTYTCYSVAASVVKAGLTPRLIDISPETLDYAPAALAAADDSRVLAMVATNLYGLPSDLPTLARQARERGIFLIDDAAQSMGASVGGRLSGTWGDAGLFSFDKGKNVSAIDGGLLLLQSDALAAAVRAEMQASARPSAMTSLIHVTKAFAYWLLLRPWLYGVPARVPQLGLGQTVFTTEYPLDGIDPALAALAAVMLARLDEFTAARRANAEALLAELPANAVATIKPGPTAVPVYLRLPILVANAREQAAVIAAMHAEGIGATRSYPASLADVPELQPHLAGRPPQAAGGREVAARLVTIPTHPFVTRHDIRRVGQVLAAFRPTPVAARLAV